MKIARIETVPVRVDIDRRVGSVADHKGFRFQSDIIVVRVVTDGGLEGLGEVNGSPDWSGETATGARALIDGHLAPRLIGADPRRIRECMGRLGRTFGNPFAKAGLEMALFDLLGKSLGAPVYQLLGGPVRSHEIPLRFAVIPVGPDESAEVAARMVAEGIRTIKMKVGRDPLPYDLDRVAAVREAVGRGVRLSVDANGGWSVNEAIRASRALEAFDVAFVEQPVHRLDLDGLAEVRRRTSLPVMADESVFTPQDALSCIDRRAADIISVYPGKNGGILDTLTIVGMAEAAGVACAIGSNMEWDIASSAMAHLAIALPNIAVERYAADIPGPFYHVQHALCSGCSYAGGVLSVPDLPGLGVVLDESLLTSLRA
jgi:L-alanine-DL-glutamate epimerase-like enolase superfamily enzyme